MSSVDTGFVCFGFLVCVVEGCMGWWGVLVLNMLCAATSDGGFLYYIL